MPYATLPVVGDFNGTNELTSTNRPTGVVGVGILLPGGGFRKLIGIANLNRAAGAVIPGTLTAQAILAKINVAASATAGVHVSIANNLLVFGLSGTTTPAKLAAPVVGPPTNITSSGFTISWPAVTGANGYRVRLNGSTLLMPGNVLTYTFSGLPAATQATADVQALDSTNAKQASNYSAAVTATTTAAQTANNYVQPGYVSTGYVS